MKTKILPVAVLVAVATGAVARAQTEEALMEIEIVKVPAWEAPAVTPPPVVSGFVAGLTAEERLAVGVEKLSAEQRAALDAQIAKEVRLARQGDVRGFAGTFLSRRTEEERGAAGLGILTTSEKYQLDRLVSRALASRPAQPPVAIARPATEGDLLLRRRSDWETHGFVQFEYGFGSGDREYKAATAAVTQVNPKTGTSFTFEYTVVDGDGWWRHRDWDWNWRRRIW